MDRTPNAEILDYNDQSGLQSTREGIESEYNCLSKMKELETRAENIEKKFAAFVTSMQAFVPSMQKDIQEFKRYSKGIRFSAKAQFDKLKG